MSDRSNEVDDLAGQLAEVRRELVRGRSAADQLQRIAGVLLRGFDASASGIWDELLRRWHLPPGEGDSMVRQLERAGSAPTVREFVVTVPLTDSGTLIGRLMIVVPSVRQASERSLGDLNQLVETATLALLAEANGAQGNSGGGSGSRHTDEPILSEMRQALDHGRFVPHLQPVVELATGRITMFDVLVRWNDPSRGWRAASEFLPAAQRAGMMLEVDGAVLSQAAALSRGWMDGGVRSVAVNLKVSTDEFHSAHFHEVLRAIIAKYRLPAGTLGLLLTGNMLTAPGVDARVAELASDGLRVLLDHYDGSRDTWAQLVNAPLSGVKIDRSIVARLDSPTGADGAADLIRTAVTSARRKNVPCIAEGVETEQQWSRLLELGCEAGLGYLWSPAVNAEIANSMLQSQPFVQRRAQLASIS